MRKIKFILNGKEVDLEVEETETLLYTLRERLKVKSVKEGCSIGECGACTVLINDRPYYSCLTLTRKVKDKHVKTVEFLSKDGLHPLQESFIEHGAVQCGYCTPGMLLSAYSLLLRKKNPGPIEVKKAISGNLCRCTGYLQIVEAIMEASAKITEKHEEERKSSETKSKDEILDELFRHKDSIVIAGGTDLLIRFRQKKAPLLDLTECEELERLYEKDNLIAIGATLSHSAIAESEILLKRAPALSYACEKIGSPQIRNMGTIGGNVVNASPAADTLPALMIHDPLCVIESKGKKRILPLNEFIIGPYKTSLEKGEILTQILIVGLDGYKEGYIKVAKREALAISRLSVAYAIKEKNGIFEDVRVAIGSVTPFPFRARRLEEKLRGKRKDTKELKELCQLLFDEIREISGDRPSYKYKFPVLRDLITKIVGDSNAD